MMATMMAAMTVVPAANNRSSSMKLIGVYSDGCFARKRLLAEELCAAPLTRLAPPRLRGYPVGAPSAFGVPSDDEAACASPSGVGGAVGGCTRGRPSVTFFWRPDGSVIEGSALAAGIQENRPVDIQLGSIIDDDMRNPRPFRRQQGTGRIELKEHSRLPSDAPWHRWLDHAERQPHARNYQTRNSGVWEVVPRRARNPGAE